MISMAVQLLLSGSMDGRERVRVSWGPSTSSSSEEREGGKEREAKEDGGKRKRDHRVGERKEERAGGR